MQALQKKQLEEQKMRELLSSNETRTIEERIEHCRSLQYEEHKDLFAISHSSIHKAAADGSIDGLKFFLNPTRRPKVRIDDFDKNGFCPMHSAAVRGSNHSIRFLLERGCDVDVRSTYGDTALMHACKENKLDTISLLFESGADITASNKAGFTAVHMAAQADNVEALQLLVELTCNKHNSALAAEKAAQLEDGGDNVSLESSTVISHNEDDSLSFVSSVFDPLQVPAVAVFLNQASRNLTTPLHMAVLNNSMRVLHALLHLRVKVDFTDSSGDTALHKAGRLQLNLAYQALLEAGASQTLKNNFGETPRDLLIDNPTY